MDKETRFREEFIDLYAEINLRSLLDKIAEKIKQYLNCAESSIFLYNPTREELYFDTATGAKKDALKQIVIKRGEGVVGWIADHNESVIINDCANDARFTSFTDEKTNFKTRSIAGVPVRMEEKLLGVLEAINKKEGRFVDGDRELLEYISHFIAIPLQNALLFKNITQESKEKAKLLELGKAISSSTNLEEGFLVLKEIIKEIIQPAAIDVLVKSRDTVYHLMTDQQEQIDSNMEEPVGNESMVVFPLRTENRNLGFLQIEARDRIPDEVISLMRGIAVFAAISIEKEELFAATLEKERMQKEIQIARDIQQSFLLHEPVQIPGLEVAYVNIPSSEVGGDYYDVIPKKGNQVVVTLNDISGHGVSASLLMSIVRTNFVYRCKRDNNLATTINHLNDLIAKTTEPNLYVTSFSCELNLHTRSISYINAGHIPPFVLRRGEVFDLEEGALVLGMFPDVAYEPVDQQLEEEDLMVLITDGIVEAENPSGEAFSQERLKRFFVERASQPLGTLKQELIDRLKQFVGRDDFEDDVTFLLIRLVSSS